MLLPFSFHIQDKVLPCFPVFLRHFAERGPASWGGGWARTLHRLAPSGHTCPDQTPSTSVLYEGGSAKSTFFSNTANYSLFNTNPNDTKVSWDLIRPNTFHVQLWVSHIMMFVSKARSQLQRHTRTYPEICKQLFNFISFILVFYFPEDTNKLYKEVIDIHWQFIFHWLFSMKDDFFYPSPTSINSTKTYQKLSHLQVSNYFLAALNRYSKKSASTSWKNLRCLRIRCDSTWGQHPAFLPVFSLLTFDAGIFFTRHQQPHFLKFLSFSSLLFVCTNWNTARENYSFIQEIQNRKIFPFKEDIQHVCIHRWSTVSMKKSPLPNTGKYWRNSLNEVKGQNTEKWNLSFLCPLKRVVFGFGTLEVMQLLTSIIKK